MNKNLQEEELHTVLLVIPASRRWGHLHGGTRDRREGAPRGGTQRSRCHIGHRTCRQILQGRFEGYRQHVHQNTREQGETMTEHKTLPREIIVELRNLLISIVRKDARNDTDTLPGGNISWLNADQTLEDSSVASLFHKNLALK